MPIHAKVVRFKLADDGQSLDKVKSYDGPSLSLGRQGSYGWHLKSQLKEVARELEALRQHREDLAQKVADWKPQAA